MFQRKVPAVSRMLLTSRDISCVSFSTVLYGCTYLNVTHLVRHIAPYHIHHATSLISNTFMIVHLRIITHITIFVLLACTYTVYNRTIFFTKALHSSKKLHLDLAYFIHNIPKYMQNSIALHLCKNFSSELNRTKNKVKSQQQKIRKKDLCNGIYFLCWTTKRRTNSTIFIFHYFG